MILANVMPTGQIKDQAEILLLKFSEPDETFKEQTWVQAHGWADAHRMVDFRNRKHFVDTLTGWINQRLHIYWRTQRAQGAVSFRYGLKNHLSSVSTLKGLAKYIVAQTPVIKSLAPPPDSKCYNYYKTNIIPIMAYCAGKEIGE